MLCKYELLQKQRLMLLEIEIEKERMHFWNNFPKMVPSTTSKSKTTEDCNDENDLKRSLVSGNS